MFTFAAIRPGTTWSPSARFWPFPPTSAQFSPVWRPRARSDVVGASWTGGGLRAWSHWMPSAIRRSPTWTAVQCGSPSAIRPGLPVGVVTRVTARERRHIGCHPPSGERPHGPIFNADRQRAGPGRWHRMRASNTRSCSHSLPSGPVPPGRRPPGSGRFRPRSPSFRTCGGRQARSASLVPTGPGGGTWARVQRQGPRAGGTNPPVSVATLDAILHPDGTACGRRHIGFHRPSGDAHMDGFPMRFAICHWAGLPVSVVTRVAIAASVRPVSPVWRPAGEVRVVDAHEHGSACELGHICSHLPSGRRPHGRLFNADRHLPSDPDRL